jgi:hypothetical protein
VHACVLLQRECLWKGLGGGDTHSARRNPSSGFGNSRDTTKSQTHPFLQRRSSCRRVHACVLLLGEWCCKAWQVVIDTQLATRLAAVGIVQQPMILVVLSVLMVVMFLRRGHAGYCARS